MKTFNKVELKGRIHSYDLKETDSEKGTAITGSVTIEASQAGALVTVRFYALPKYNNGNTNRTYTVLENMLAGNYKTIVNDADEADWIAIDANIDIDYYVGRDGAKTIDDMNRSQRVRGSFINANKNHDYSNTWRCDMLIYRIEEMEANPEKNYPHKARIHGWIIDDYRQRLMGVRFDVLDDAAINYVLSLSAATDNPIYTSAKGEFRKITTLQVHEGAFGEDETIEYENLLWVMTWLPKNTYLFGEDITLDEFKAYSDALDEYKTTKLNEHNNKSDEGAGLVF